MMLAVLCSEKPKQKRKTMTFPQIHGSTWQHHQSFFFAVVHGERSMLLLVKVMEVKEHVVKGKICF